ncbi:2-dehydropantoate 2-reductase [Acidovorax sp. GBBC 3334]|uniref:2-dehydropantoate 2-reductase n=1 Tax=Acidovorax sp. GBBC 3334 TaxID=2940496 RepID=UPI002304CB82|nr:2-dehydropantoate 2-reductase [Acidovorax sp. GBBC 3334]MDA8455031.1 2-dehydropantoate 2-reductase [Acidovorax sp. GBBC 3334]
MHFIVMGAGAVGLYVGGRLAAAGQAVTLVGRPRILGAVAQAGLRVSDLEGFDAQVPAHALRLAHAPDAIVPAGPATVLLCVKGGATAQAAQALAAALPADTPVVSLQNGVDNVARIAAQAPALQALGAMVPYNVVLRGTHVHRATTGSLHLQHAPATAALADAFRAAGLAAVLAGDIRPVQWGKLLLNLNNPVNALSDLPLREELQDRDCRCVFAALQAEALRAMARAGIRPAKVAPVPPRLLPHVLRLPDALFTRLARRMLRIDPAARSSMWDDLQAGRPTEIDDLCGAVVRLAAVHGVPAPCNARMCALLAGPRQRLTGAQMREALGL